MGSILVLVNRQKNNVVRKPSLYEVRAFSDLKFEQIKLLQLSIWGPEQIILHEANETSEANEVNEAIKSVSFRFC